jgi:hypothetical protein
VTRFLPLTEVFALSHSRSHAHAQLHFLVRFQMGAALLISLHLPWLVSGALLALLVLLPTLPTMVMRAKVLSRGQNLYS